jgi:transcriptional regulator with XRE-family HTH domain
MPVRRGPTDIGKDRGRQLVASVCRQIEDARIDRGLSYASLGRALALTGQQVARVCQGRSPMVALDRLARLAALVGLDLSARTYPAGQPLRDGAQRALLERFRARLGAEVRWQSEVPVVPGNLDGRPDLRAWDAVVAGRGWRAGVEAETHVGDAQSLLRRLALKHRDGNVDGGLVLVLNDSRHHRALMRSMADELSATFPVEARTAMRRLARGEAPGHAVVLL